MISSALNAEEKFLWPHFSHTGKWQQIDYRNWYVAIPFQYSSELKSDLAGKETPIGIDLGLRNG